VSEQPKISDEAVELAAKLLYERHHKYFGTFNEWTMRHWDAGPQHVNRQPWLDDASALLAAAYPLLRQQWEADFLERMKAHGGDQWLEGYEAGCSMSHSLGCDAVEAQRDALVAEVARLRKNGGDRV
jgi:hypothetical protein